MLIECVLAIISILLLIPTLVLFTQVVCAFFPQKIAQKIVHRDVSVAVLIPAHNESSGIVATLNSIKPQMKAIDRLLVVADNCNDDTAAMALTHGAEVIVRDNLLKCGKGYALDFGIRYLSEKPVDIVIIIDADCLLEACGLDQIAQQALLHGRPVQALYLMHAKIKNLKSEISEFAWCVKNLVRPLGYAKLGLPCQLMGTGMAFPWSIISKADLANGNIVEDMKLGIDLSITGTPPLFYSLTKVTSFFPTVPKTQSGQSARWEHGHLTMILSEAPRLFFQALSKSNKNLFAMALDLAVPPLALMLILLFSDVAITGASLMLYDVGYLAFYIALCSVTFFGMSIAMAWVGWGRTILSFSTILLVPVYVLSKIPHYVTFLFKRQKTWNKTERD